ncbi:hypothetical protein ACFC09_20165 [Streptomyces sp. NPDC056161]|uniref:hypothetical protein n=1 Tax=Streptomyces sp. NPDC056161 TaxID=3345732 RepID=UPI0035D9317C
MHAMTPQRRLLLVAGIAVGCVVLAGPVHADVAPGGGNEGSDPKPEGSRSGQTLESRIAFSGSVKESDSASGPLVPAGDWTPPACWYEPYSADEFAKTTEAGYDLVANDPQQPNYAKSAVAQNRDYYKDGKYKNYNKDKADEGSWWVATRDPDRWLSDEAQKCNKQPFWVKNGETPNVENAVTPEMLAQLAYNRVKVPDTKVSLAPANITKVNLATWAWLDRATFKPVSVTAQLNANGLSIQATTTAKPVSLKLEPGTADAETFPASGECAFNADGSIGEPYAKGKADDIPPCGVTYLRSSGDTAFHLKATITWQISWTGTGGAGGDLPNGTFGTTQDVTAQEAQALNR